jgi:hypothetical protein
MAKKTDADRKETRIVSQAGASSGEFELEATEVLTALQSAIQKVIAQFPEPIRKSTDLQKSLQLDTKLAWQLYKFSEAESAFSASPMLPGLLPLERFLHASAKRGISPALLVKVREHFNEFEHFVELRAGSRASFNSMVGAGNRDARAVDLYHSKAVFRAAAHFRGVQTNTHCITMMLHPSMKAPGGLDLATLSYKLGVRRLRPDVRVMLSTVHKTPPGNEPDKQLFERKSWFEPLTTGGADAGVVATLLSSFCSNPSAEMIVTHDVGETLRVELAAGGIGKDASTDWAFGVVERNIQIRLDQPQPIPFNLNIAAAVQTLVLDFIFYDDGGPEPVTDVNVYVGFGSDEANAENSDRALSLSQTVEFKGRGLSALREPLAPRLPEMVGYACEKLGWKPQEMKVYRCRVEYPFLGSHICVKFDFNRAGPSSPSH